MASPATLFKERAHWLKRDLREGTVQRSELSQYIRSDWDKDEDEYRGSYGVTSYAQFHKGVMAAIGGGSAVQRGKRPAKHTTKTVRKAPKRSTKKAPVKKFSAEALKRRACKSKRIPAFLKRYC